MRLPAPLPDGCAMQMRYLQSSLQCCNRSLLQVPQSSSYLVPTFLFPIIANTATKVTVPIYTVPTITHDLQRNTSKEPIPKTRNPFRLFRFFCTAVSGLLACATGPSIANTHRSAASTIQSTSGTSAYASMYRESIMTAPQPP